VICHERVGVLGRSAVVAWIDFTEIGELFRRCPCGIVELSVDLDLLAEPRNVEGKDAVGFEMGGVGVDRRVVAGGRHAHGRHGQGGDNTERGGYQNPGPVHETGPPRGRRSWPGMATSYRTAWGSSPCCRLGRVPPRFGSKKSPNNPLTRYESCNR